MSTTKNHSAITDGEKTTQKIAVKNLIAIKDEKKVNEVIKKIINGEEIHLNIADNNKSKELRMEGQPILTFDCSQHGSKKSNANSIIRDLAKTINPGITRKTIEALVLFH